MKMKIRRKRRPKKGEIVFQPDREMVRKAVEEYLDSGRMIKITRATPDNFEQFMSLQATSCVMDV